MIQLYNLWSGFCTFCDREVYGGFVEGVFLQYMFEMCFKYFVGWYLEALEFVLNRIFM